MKDPDIEKNLIPIFVVSGGRGVAGHTMVHSLLIQYPDHKLPVNVIPNVQSIDKIEEVVLKVKKENGLLTHTMVNDQLRKELIRTCEKYKVRHIDFMGPLADFLEQEIGLKSIQVPGLYRRINSQYFDRIEAMEFTVNHDDGLNPDKLCKAEIILIGVSRSGKTPLSIYMSMFGWKIANVPIVKGIEPPPELFRVNPNRVFGLSIGINYLIAQRYKRIKQLKRPEDDIYIEQSSVRDEIQYFNFLLEKGKFTKIEVTNKPVETTANEIIGIISDRFGADKDKIKPWDC